MESRNVEIWKDIEGFEGTYQVSNLGRVKSLARLIQCNPLAIKKKQLKEIILRQRKRKSRGGWYWMVNLYKNGKETTMNVHRLIAKAFIPNPNNLPQVNHIDGIKNNNSLDNLEWVDASCNAKHAYRIGLLNMPSVTGSKNGRSIICEKEVLEIRKRYKKGASSRALSEEYQLSIQSVQDINARRTWRHI